MNNLGVQNGQSVGQVLTQPTGAGQPVVGATGGAPVGVSGGVATFTQEQVNTIVSGRVNDLNGKIAELSAQLAQQQQLANTYYAELNGMKQRDAVRQAGVPTPYVDFVVFEANKLAVGGKTFDVAMKEFVDTNKSLFGVTQTEGQGVAGNTQPAVAPTQGVVNPAQPAQVQQVQQVAQQVAVGVQPTVGVVPQSATQPVVAAQPTAQVQPQAAPVANPTASSTFVVGATGYPAVGGVGGASTVESEVDAFLKQKGVKK